MFENKDLKGSKEKSKYRCPEETPKGTSNSGYPGDNGMSRYRNIGFTWQTLHCIWNDEIREQWGETRGNLGKRGEMTIAHMQSR
jgi:hypothetical protein